MKFRNYYQEPNFREDCPTEIEKYEQSQEIEELIDDALDFTFLDKEEQYYKKLLKGDTNETI